MTLHAGIPQFGRRGLGFLRRGQPPEHLAGQGPKPLERLGLDGQDGRATRVRVKPECLGGYRQMEPPDVLEVKDVVGPKRSLFLDRRLRDPDGRPKPVAGNREERGAREHPVDQGEVKNRTLIGSLQHCEKEQGPNGQKGEAPLKL